MEMIELMKCIQSKFMNNSISSLFYENFHFSSRQSNEFELNFSRVLLSDSGNYTCKAFNDIGEDESETITVDSEFVVVNHKMFIYDYYFNYLLVLAATGICSRLKFSSVIDGCFWIRNKISS